MSFDNRVFNVNGTGKAGLLAALELAFSQEGAGKKAKGFVNSPEKGLVLCWWCDGQSGPFPLPATLDAAGVLPMVLSYLESDEAKLVPCEGWDANADHDGSNSEGWRVYVEDWGHVGGNSYAICAIRRAFVWHGK
jgi:hypothetical protein